MLIKHVKNIKINQFKKIIFKSKKPRYIFELSKKISNKKDLEIAENLIIESKSSQYIRLFAENIKQANIRKLEKALLNLGDMVQIKKFAKNVKTSKMKIFLLMS
jgi:hypothetical protein